MQNLSQFPGRRILVVEDEPLIAMLMETMLADLGCVVLGPIHTVDEALALLGEGAPLDVALLDLNLDGKPVLAVADALRARAVPIIFCTGYGAEGLRAADRDAPVLRKPYRTADLAAALAGILAIP